MDKVFTKPIKKQFEFDENVAIVFDDMLDRSVPFYKEVIEFVSDFICLHVKSNASILDLGCSTANTLLALWKKSNKTYNLVGIDNAEAMLDIAKRKILAYNAPIALRCEDILSADFALQDVIIANYMLQFIRPIERADFVSKIYNSLNKDGIFVFSEKIVFEDKALGKQMIDLYHAFKKKQGYSDFEISQKREALENVLVPYTEEENKKMVKNAGFKTVETFFKWGNFVTFVAIK